MRVKLEIADYDMMNAVENVVSMALAVSAQLERSQEKSSQA
jgi:hypothetical protein